MLFQQSTLRADRHRRHERRPRAARLRRGRRARACANDASLRALLVGDPATIEGALDGSLSGQMRERLEIVPATAGRGDG